MSDIKKTITFGEFIKLLIPDIELNDTQREVVRRYDAGEIECFKIDPNYARKVGRGL